MGCSNSSARGSNDPEKDASDDTTSQDDKHRNYGGVYVGLPTEASITQQDLKAAEANRKHGTQLLNPLYQRMSASKKLFN